MITDQLEEDGKTITAIEVDKAEEVAVDLAEAEVEETTITAISKKGTSSKYYKVNPVLI
jgi:hypothetical protein